MRYMAIAFPLAILMDCIIFINFFQWQQQSIYEFEQRQMDLQVNYAVDAAVQEMLANGEHLGTDYASWGEMNLEPEYALDVYLAVLIRNLGWADSEQNRKDLIESSMPFFCVAVYDGYYMYSRQQEKVITTTNNGDNIENTVYEMRWTPKLPYCETVGSGDSRVAYFYNLGETEYGTLRCYNGSVKADNPLSRTSEGPGSINRSKIVVSGTLTDACNSAMFAGLEGNVDSRIYIPATFSEWSNSNPVDRPTVLVYMSPMFTESQYDVVTFGLGGARVDSNEFCIAYERNGSKLYTFADMRDKVLASGVSQILDVYTSPKEAAEHGYYFDITMR